MIHFTQLNRTVGLILITVVILVAACTGPLVAPAPADAPVPTDGSTLAEAPTPTEPVAAPTEPLQPQVAAEPETIILMSHDSFNVSDEVVKAFEEVNNAKIEFLRAGDAGATLNQAILSKENPLADVFFGVDNTFFSRAIAGEIFEPYHSPLLANVADELKLDADNRLLPVDYGDVCLNYDKAWFNDKGLAPPTNLEDLAKPEYAGLTVVENPATSSPGLAFLLATIAHFGEDGYLDYWQQLVDNDVLVVDGWEDAYFGQFTRYEGARPLVVSYASSPPAEIFYAETPLDDAPTASVIGAGSCFRQIEFIGILAGTQKRPLAEKLVDFMLDIPFQEDIPLNMFVFPANTNAALPELFIKHAQLADSPATLDPATIAANREAWLTAWTEKVLR